MRKDFLKNQGCYLTINPSQDIKLGNTDDRKAKKKQKK